jgi:hypothetical protein
LPKDPEAFLANWVKTRGKGYIITEGDGLSYSYSVYDSHNQLARWASNVFLLPTENLCGSSWSGPLLTSSVVLLAAIRESSNDLASLRNLP